MKIFLIEKNCSDWESVPEVIGFVLTEELAVEKTDHLNFLEKEVKSLISKVDEYRKNVIYLELPVPTYINSPQYPKWMAGISQNDITPQMREERESIKKLQESNSKINSMLANEWDEKKKQMENKFIEELNVDPEILSHMKIYGNDYVSNFTYRSIEEI